MRPENEWLGRIRNLTTNDVMGCRCYGGYITLYGEPFSVAVSTRENHIGYYMEHVSISHKNLTKLPSWKQMCLLKDIFWEDEEECFQLHPKKSEYVNLMPNCLHIWRRVDV